ncbi:MAG: SAM-dependent methyltransferase, partial [Actinomycetes bacterium]
MTGAPGVVGALHDRIERLGSVRFDEFVELALYHEPDGFFAGGAGAGRAGADFVTAPEVGPLFGAVVARYLDERWQQLGRPDPFVVVESAAGRGALAISVLAAAPECAPALRYVLVERSAALRDAHGAHLPLSRPFEILGPAFDPDDDAPSPVQGIGPLCCSLEDLPSEPIVGVVVANELLDNVPFRLFERSAAAWREVRVTARDGQFAELVVDGEPELQRRLDDLAPDAPVGARIPLQHGAVEWLGRALGVVRSGSVLVFDYTDTTAALAQRPADEWMRTYAAHQFGAAPLDAVGLQDITCEVALDQLSNVRTPDLVVAQAEWLRRHGLDDLVEEGRRRWESGAAGGGLAAIAGR